MLRIPANQDSILFRRYLTGREFGPALSDQTGGAHFSIHNYRLLNWKRRRAPFCPYFLRSFMRESRVRKPFFRKLGRRSGFSFESARESPMRTAPACPPTPPLFTIARTST